MRRKMTRGVTMTELLVSLNIIVFGIFVMAMVMMMLLRSGQKNIDNSSAYIVADSVMKEYLSKHIDSLEHGYDSRTENTPFSYADKKFHYKIEASQISGYGDMIYLKASVEEIEASGGSSDMKAVISTRDSKRIGGISVQETHNMGGNSI